MPRPRLWPLALLLLLLAVQPTGCGDTPPLGTPCADDADCGRRGICKLLMISGSRTPQCTVECQQSDGPCEEVYGEGICLGFLCGPDCGTDAHCPDGTRCNQHGVCSPTCTSDEDCVASCDEGVCR